MGGSALSRFIRGEQGDMVWAALILVFVLLPLAGLAVDAPRYFALKEALQTATDNAAQAAAQCVDLQHFRETGETILDEACARAEALAVVEATVVPLRRKGYTARLVSLTVDAGRQRVTATAEGGLRLIFNLTPRLTVRAHTTSEYRVAVR